MGMNAGVEGGSKVGQVSARMTRRRLGPPSWKPGGGRTGWFGESASAWNGPSDDTCS